MPLTPEQVTELKNQLKEQIGHLSPEQKREAEKQIEEMSAEALELMLKQQSSGGGKTIFRMIVDGDVESIKVGENSSAVAVLDINPISKGHILIIPRKPVKLPKQIPKQAFALARELSKKITDNLKSKEVKAETEIKFGEAVLNIIPIYDKPLSASSPRTKATTEELNQIKRELETIRIENKPEKIIQRNPKEKKEPILKLNRRIP